MKKKLLAILLAAIMVMTLLPTVAFATEIIALSEVNVSLAYDFDEKTMSFTPAPENEGTYEIPEEFSIYAFDEDEILLYVYNGEADGSDGEWNDGFGLEIEENEVDMTAVSFLVYEFHLAMRGDYRFKTEGLSVKVNNNSLAELGESDLDETGDCMLRTGYTNPDKNGVDSSENLYIYIRQDLPKANIKGVITPADFGYEMVIPASTLLTEAAHENVLLGTTAEKAGDGIVTVKDIKHGGGSMEISYTVDLENGTLTNGTTTIDATYKYKQGANEFATIVDDNAEGATEVTVYTGGSITDSIVNVTADKTKWNAAPVGDYNATLVFNFVSKLVCPVDLEAYPMLYKIVAMDDENAYIAMYSYEDGSFILSDEECESQSHDTLRSMFGNYVVGDCFHISESYDILKCKAPNELGINDIVFTVTDDGDTEYYVVPAGTGYSISDGVLTIDLDEDITLGESGYKWTLGGADAEPSGTITDGDSFVGIPAATE